MAENQKRPEATHRQRVDLGHASVPLGEDGQAMAVVSCSASDLVPTVQFGNVLLHCSITRAVHDDGDADALVERAREVMRTAEAVVGSERRAVQWAIDPSLRVTMPSGVDVPGVPFLPPPPAPTATPVESPAAGASPAPSTE